MMIIERYYAVLEGEDLWSIIVLEKDPQDDNREILHNSRGREPLEYHSPRERDQCDDKILHTPSVLEHKA